MHAIGHCNQKLVTVLRTYALILFTLLTTAFAAVADSPVRLTGDKLSDKLVSALEDELLDEEAPGSVFEARRQAKRAASRLSDYLNSEGYFAAEVEASVIGGPPIEPVVDIISGQRFRIGTVDIALDAPDAVQGAIAVTPPIQSGAIALPAEIRAAEARLLVSIREQGYAFAEILPMEAIGDREAATLDLVFRIKPGNRIRFGEVTYRGETRTRKSFNNKLIPFQTGDVYTPKALGEFNSRLVETRLYTVSAAALSPTPVGETENGDAIHDVIVTLTERKRNTITAGASYSTAEGPGLAVEFVQRNTIAQGDILSLRTTLAQQEQSVRADWTLPHIAGYGRALNAHMEVGREDTDAFERNALLLGLNLNIKRREHVSYIFGVASESTIETDSNGRRTLQTLSTSGAVSLDYSDNFLDPTRGWRADLRLEPGIVLGDEREEFLATTGQVSFYQPLYKDRTLVLATRARVGSVIGAPTIALPTSRRFFAGGGGSARGFGFQEVGPRDADNTPIGGRSLLEFTGELRWRYNERYGFAVFADAASVTDSSTPSVNDLRLGVGGGVRYYTGFGPIRLDVAVPIDREDGDSALQVYISIGQAF